MRFKIVVCTLLILSVFSFVLAYPIPKREVREAGTDAAEGGENVISVSGKRRAPRGNNPYGSDSHWSGSESESDTEWWTPESKPLPAPSGSHPGVDMPSSSSLRSESLFSKVWSTLGGPAKKVSWGPVTDMEDGTEVPERAKPGTTTENHPLPPPPGREGYLDKEAAHTSPEGFMGNVKSYFGKFLSKL